MHQLWHLCLVLGKRQLSMHTLRHTVTTTLASGTRAAVLTPSSAVTAAWHTVAHINTYARHTLHLLHYPTAAPNTWLYN